ncbi:hypothetical protein A2755_03745 [Candidatus Wolfebacteria bacterium RIFCSPHIGHO2_01_FULL_48_22]|uniref:RNA polymerase alpha subunit C-terminal domain-containing protein n=2 Tax=Candidatus Wolfeibacteriota TaxID=1752735 RepID=A0A1F8DNS7_9BACT|nr:MAG: hypothetical protein A2755_03745 [Candidatus Wolfebacteria bacterium RIFCSPHIGHO2_01_FULL_48_22]OGM93454.1 MAG: hypothetical protein A2935_01095 [Candidatus Wolfebacteria bacterium RIFCSPLOWO2_01_FULL_47_17b]
MNRKFINKKGRKMKNSSEQKRLTVIKFLLGFASSTELIDDRIKNIMERVLVEGETLVRIAKDLDLSAPYVGQLFRVGFSKIRHGLSFLGEKDMASAKENLSEFSTLSIRAQNCLKRSGIKNFDDLKKFSKPDLLGCSNFGKKSLVEIEEFLAKKGLPPLKD